MNQKSGTNLLQELLNENHLPFQVVPSQAWKEGCPEVIKGGEIHQSDNSRVCFSCRRIHILEEDYDKLTLEKIGVVVVFIGQKYHRRMIKNAN